MGQNFDFKELLHLHLLIMNMNLKRRVADLSLFFFFLVYCTLKIDISLCQLFVEGLDLSLTEAFGTFSPCVFLLCHFQVGVRLGKNFLCVLTNEGRFLFFFHSICFPLSFFYF
ncbi:hypothetical protein ACOSQ3_026395 [Xanthoceras sorbifolium]